jgi:hypothetical protein
MISDSILLHMVHSKCLKEPKLSIGDTLSNTMEDLKNHNSATMLS